MPGNPVFGLRSGGLKNVSHPFFAVDVFEDNNINEYTGNTNNFSTSNDQAYKSDRSLKKTNTANWEMLYSNSGLDNYPEQGNEIRCKFYIASGAGGVGIAWGVSDTNNHYRAIGRYDSNDDIQLQVFDGGSSSSIDSIGGVGWSNYTDQWNEFIVTWQSDGSMTVKAEDNTGSQIFSVSGSDTTYNSGGIGFVSGSGGSGGTTYFDHYRYTKI